MDGKIWHTEKVQVILAPTQHSVVMTCVNTAGRHVTCEHTSPTERPDSLTSGFDISSVRIFWGQAFRWVFYL